MKLNVYLIFLYLLPLTFCKRYSFRGYILNLLKLNKLKKKLNKNTNILQTKLKSIYYDIIYNYYNITEEDKMLLEEAINSITF